jgi:hypothetical protein
LGEIKNKHPEEFSKLFTDDYHGVYSSGVNTKKYEIESSQECDLQKFSLTEAEVVFPTDDTAIVIYKNAVDNFTHGQDISGSFYNSSVWVNRDGQWLLILHTEARINKA